MEKKIETLIKSIEELSILEVSGLVKALEEKFGVSAAAPMVAAAGITAADGASAEAEEKDAYTVVLTAVDNKINAIKALREINPDLGLKEAKELTETLPANVAENVKTEAAKEMQKKLEDAGAKVELK